MCVQPFGFTPDDREALVLEPCFILMYYMGFTFKEYMNIPVVYKRWFIERVTREINGTSQDGEPGNGNSKARHHNPPDVEALMGKHHPNAPNRLRRFT